EAALADVGPAVGARRAVDRDVLTEHGPRADPDPGRRALLELQVLRPAAEHGAVADLHAAPELHAPLEHAVVADLHVGADRRLGADDRERADPGGRMDSRAGVHAGARVDGLSHSAPPPRPIRHDPAIPTWATMIECSPISTLWPICTRLSILVPRRMIVCPSVARSIVVFAPISTSSSTSTEPTCGIFRCASPSKA